MSITAKVTGFSEAQTALLERRALLIGALYRKVFSLLIQVQSKIQGNLAQGIGLKSRHGTAGLAGSVRVIPPAVEGAIIKGSVEGGGGPFWYGGMWEFTGHKEIVPVTKKSLSWLADGKRVFAMRVSAQAPRPWMIPPFEEMKPYIAEQLQEAATSATKGTETP